MLEAGPPFRTRTTIEMSDYSFVQAEHSSVERAIKHIAAVLLHEADDARRAMPVTIRVERVYLSSPDLLPTLETAFTGSTEEPI